MSCDLCAGYGLVSALLRKNQLAEYSFRCPRCPPHPKQPLSRSIKLWDDAFEKDFILLRFGPAITNEEIPF